MPNPWLKSYPHPPSSMRQHSHVLLRHEDDFEPILSSLSSFILIISDISPLLHMGQITWVSQIYQYSLKLLKCCTSVWIVILSSPKMQPPHGSYTSVYGTVPTVRGSPVFWDLFLLGAMEHPFLTPDPVAFCLPDNLPKGHILCITSAWLCARMWWSLSKCLLNKWVN